MHSNPTSADGTTNTDELREILISYQHKLANLVKETDDDNEWDITIGTIPGDSSDENLENHQLLYKLLLEKLHLESKVNINVKGISNKQIFLNKQKSDQYKPGLFNLISPEKSKTKSKHDFDPKQNSSHLDIDVEENINKAQKNKEETMIYVNNTNNNAAINDDITVSSTEHDNDDTFEQVDKNQHILFESNVTKMIQPPPSQLPHKRLRFIGAADITVLSEKAVEQIPEQILRNARVLDSDIFIRRLETFFTTNTSSPISAVDTAKELSGGLNNKDDDMTQFDDSTLSSCDSFDDKNIYSSSSPLDTTTSTANSRSSSPNSSSTSSSTSSPPFYPQTQDIHGHINLPKISLPRTDYAIACFNVLDVENNMNCSYCEWELWKIDAPYISSLLSLREAECILQLLERYKSKVVDTSLHPDILLVDGNGVLHERKSGIASMIGVLAQTTTIGVSKKLHALPLEGITSPYDSFLRSMMNSKECEEDNTIKAVTISNKKCKKNYIDVVPEFFAFLKSFDPSYYTKEYILELYQKQMILQRQLKTSDDDDDEKDDHCTDIDNISSVDNVQDVHNEIQIDEMDLEKIEQDIQTHQGTIRGAILSQIPHIVKKSMSTYTITINNGQHDNNSSDTFHDDMINVSGLSEQVIQKQQTCLYLKSLFENPIYVSIGHNISLPLAIFIVTILCKVRIPEPIRISDLYSRSICRTILEGKMSWENKNEIIY